jgi:hypothetical protein
LGGSGPVGNAEMEKVFLGVGELNESGDDCLFYLSRGRRCSPVFV